MINISDTYKNVRRKGFFHLLSANFLIQLVAFASQLIVAGILSPDDIGRIKIIQTYLSVFSIAAGMGFNASTLKLCSEDRSQADQIKLFRSAFLFTLISTISLYIIILVANALKVFSSDLYIRAIIPLGLFPLISNSLFMVFVSYTQATKQIKLMSNLTISNKIISISAIIIFTYWLKLEGYYIAYNLSFILMLVVCFRAFKSAFSGKIHFSEMKSLIPVHWQYARNSMLTNVLSEVSAYLDILMINFFITDMHEIGYYSFAVTLTVALRIFPSTVQQISIPYFSAFSKQDADFKYIFHKYNRLLFAGVILTLGAAVTLGPIIINWLFNNKYEASMHYFIFLSIGWSIRQLTQLQSGAIFGLGKIQYNVYVSLLSTIFNIIIYSISLHYFGLMGAAFASILSGVAIWSFSRYYYGKALKESFPETVN